MFYAAAMRDVQDLRIEDVPREVMRGLRMVSCKRDVSMRIWIQHVLYEALDRELADWPEWRYQTKPGDEKLFVDGRKAAGLKRRKKKVDLDK